MEHKNQQILPIQYIPVTQCEEDEIDLKELIKTILKYKKFIIIFTFFITFLAALYVFLKTPIWETQSSILIGQINSKPIITPENLKEYLNSIYKVELEKKFKKMPNAYLSDITIPKKSDLFITLTIDGLSNNYDLQKLKEVLNNIHNGFKDKIEKYRLQKQNEIQNIKFQIQKIKNVTVPNIKTQIKFLQNKIKLQKNLIKYYKNQIKAIDQKIKFLNKNIDQYKKLIDQLIKDNNNNNNNISSNLIISNKIISYQNMITDYTNQIKDLSLQKNKIISQTIPDIYDNIENLQNKIDNLNKSLKFDIPQQIQNLKNQIAQINLALKNTFAAKEIGKPLMFDHPIKPKKKLIITVAFITGLILSIFLVFFIEFIKSFKENSI